MISQTNLASASIPEEERLRRIVQNVQRNFETNAMLTKNVTRALESTVMANPLVSEVPPKEEGAEEGFEGDLEYKNVQVGRNHQKTLAELKEENAQLGSKISADAQTEFRKSGIAMNAMYLLRQQQNTLIRVSFLMAAVAGMFYLNTLIAINPLVMQVLMVLIGVLVGRELFFLFEGARPQEASDYETIRGRGDKMQRTEGFENEEEQEEVADEEQEEPVGSQPEDTFVAEQKE